MSAELLEHLRELLAGIGQVSARPMFGGHGIYADGVIFGIVIDDRLYLKVDAETEARFRAGGSAPFVYTGQRKPITMSYWSVPDEAMDSASEMRPWARLALAAAMRKQARRTAASQIRAKKPKRTPSR